MNTHGNTPDFLDTKILTSNILTFTPMIPPWTLERQSKAQHGHQHSPCTTAIFAFRRIHACYQLLQNITVFNGCKSFKTACMLIFSHS